MGPSGHFTHGLLYWIVGTGYIPAMYPGSVQRRLCPIFLRNVGSPDIHECFRGLTDSQWTLRFWGVTAWYQSLGIRIPREIGFGYPSPLGWFDVWFRYEIT